MKPAQDCAALRRYLQDCLDNGEAPAEERTRHLTACPDCRAWHETLRAAAGRLRAALEAESAQLPPLKPEAFHAFHALHPRVRAKHAARRRLTAAAAVLVLAVGLGTAAGLRRRQHIRAARAETLSDYLVEILFAPRLLEDADLGLVLEGNGGIVWPADTLESEELYTMEPLTLF